MNDVFLDELPDTESHDERMGLPSASSADADFRCHGRRAMIAKVIKPDDSTKWSKRGDKIHKALEESDLTKLSSSDSITAERIMDEEARLADHYSLQGAVVYRERRWWAMEGEKRLYSGKLDCIHHVADLQFALVVDYKTGFAPVVSIDRNFQVKMQVVLAHLNIGIRRAVGALIHPHHPDNLLSQTRVFTEREILFAKDEIDGHLAEMTDSAPRTPNATSCQYCPARHLCPEYNAWMEEIIPKEKVEALQAKIEVMTPEERGVRLQKHKLAKALMDEEKEICKAMLKKDEKSIFGWKLVPSSERVCTDPIKAKQIVEDAYGLQVADMCMDFSFTKCETVLVESGAIAIKKKAKETVNELLAPVLDKKRREPSLKEC